MTGFKRTMKAAFWTKMTSYICFVIVCAFKYITLCFLSNTCFPFFMILLWIQVSLLEENIKPRTDLPHLLVHLRERRPEKLHYIGVSFGLTSDLFRFWRRHKFAPFYIGQIPVKLYFFLTGRLWHWNYYYNQFTYCFLNLIEYCDWWAFLYDPEALK